MELSRWVLKTEALLLLCALLSTVLPGRAARAATPLWWLSAACGLAYAAMRYWLTWPMTPMFAGSILFAPLLVLLGTVAPRGGEPASARTLQRWLMAGGLIVVLIGVCFPKDFYLPIIKTTSLYAHGVLLFAAFGRACFFVAAAWGCVVLGGDEHALPRMFRWLIWGFGCWTLSLFSGEVWSYSGWGVPMVWEDASTLTAIGTWLYYVGLIHLQRGGLMRRRSRAALCVCGALLLLVFNGGPEMGPFCNPLGETWRA